MLVVCGFVVMALTVALDATVRLSRRVFDLLLTAVMVLFGFSWIHYHVWGSLLFFLGAAFYIIDGFCWKHYLNLLVRIKTRRSTKDES